MKQQIHQEQDSIQSIGHLEKQVETIEFKSLYTDIRSIETSISDVLKKVVFLSDKTTLEVHTQFRENGFSGIRVSLDLNHWIHFQFAPLISGGFITITESQFNSTYEKRIDLFESGGELKISGALSHPNLLYVDLISMEDRCPFISHLYSILSFEYTAAKDGNAFSQRILTIHRFLESLSPHLKRKLGVNQKQKDPALVAFKNRTEISASDSALHYPERRKLIKKIADERKQFIQTKSRVHKLKKSTYSFPLFLQWMGIRLRSFTKKPIDNLIGLIKRMTIGNLIWFFQTVRNNIGYSIALAVYAPFTFYFITQPVNPHAMWAVGKIRTALISTLNEFEEYLEETKTPPVVISAPKTSAAIKTLKKLPLSTDSLKVDRQSWEDRMSHFKDMQIAYEENMQVAPRMGRLEQMETQLNFPLIAESAYREITRFEDSLSQAKRKKPHLNPYFNAEENRAQELKLYLWDRMVRYLYDHKYVVMNESDEQKFIDPYIGRGFIFLESLTHDLQSKNKDLKKPYGFERVEKLARFYQKKKKNGKTVLDRIQKNSTLFQQKDPYDSKELRSYIQRQWEILYLLQNKAQEASNSGLQMYTWSVRNAIWVIESLYSSKRRELELLFDNTRSFKEKKREISFEIDPLLESLFHILTLEYVSIQGELSERLENDIESKQRRVVIQNIESYLKDREKYLLPALQN